MFKMNCHNEYYNLLELSQLSNSVKDNLLVKDIICDEEIMRSVSIFDGKPARSEKEWQNCIKMLSCSDYYNSGLGQYKITNDDDILGIIGAIVDRVHFGQVHSVEVGYLLRPKAQGKQVATDALSCFIKFLFERITSLQEICATTLVTNEASQRVLAKNGFINLGLGRGSRVASKERKVFLFRRNRDAKP